MTHNCEMCGNPFPVHLNQCPYCSQEHEPKRTNSEPYPKLNIKADMPTVEEARRIMHQRLRELRSGGAKVVKIIHGYGSSGVGGEIRKGARSSLVKQSRKGFFKSVIFGEYFDSDNPDVRQLISRHPQLREDNDYNRKNLGVTLVEF